MGTELRDFSQRDELTDVALVVDGHRLHVHKQYLAEWSPVWKRMFTSSFREKYAKEVPLPDKKLLEIVELLHCIYPSQKAITEKNVAFLLQLSDEYQIENLKARCEEYLATQISSLHTLILARRYNLSKLEHRCIEYAKTRTLEDLESCEEFGELDSKTHLDIYKAKIDMMREYANYLQTREKDLQRKVEREHDKKEKLGNTINYIQQLWDTPTKRCYKHMAVGPFEFGCRECNEKIHREIKKHCSIYESSYDRLTKTLSFL